MGGSFLDEIISIKTGFNFSAMSITLLLFSNKNTTTVKGNKMQLINLYAAWIGILLGFVAGAVLGLFFYKEDWMGGYSSWRRRMARLGHISFFGIAFINITYSLSITAFNIHIETPYPSYLFVAGAIAMPLICFLSAYKKIFRHLFFIPVLCLVGGTLLFFIQGIIS